MQRERESPRSSRRIHGRSEELVEAIALLAKGERLLTLRGPPGVGKTTLARALVERLALEGRRVFFASLDGVDARAAALATIARALGLSPRTSNEAVVLERIIRQLDTGTATLVLDGVDAIRADARSIVDDLLAETTDLSIVTGSRTALASPLEIVVTLAPLAVDVATALLVERVGRAAPKRTIEPELARELAQRSAGLPLAIEIVAGWVASLGARETLSALREGELALDALDQALDASWTLLGVEERRAFGACSVFRKTFDIEAARAVVGASRAASDLATLVSASLLDVHDTCDGARYAMLEGVRDYAARRAPAEAVDARERLAQHLATCTRPRADLPASWRRLAEERDDLVVAWEHAIDRDPRSALRLAVVLEPSLAAQGPPSLHRAILERSIAASETAGLPELAEAHAAATVDLLYALGRLEALGGHHEASRALLERGIALAERHADGVRTAWLIAHLAMSLRALGRVDEAAALVERARAVESREADARLHATVERAAGALHLAGGRLEPAGEAYRRAGVAARAASASRLEGLALLGSGQVHLARGDLDAASSAFAEARSCFEIATDARHLARLAVHEGAVALRRGDVTDAEERFARALDDVVLQDDVEGELEARLGLVRAARARDDTRLAERRLDELALGVRRTDDVSWKRRLAELGEAIASRDAIVLTLTRDGRSFELGSRAVDFGRRGPLRRILLALAERRRAPDRALSVAETLAVGWPGERMRHESGAARVYMAIRRLRMLGLEPILRTSDAGYALDESVAIVWRD
ncbi:MAG: AAA family ATPase [Labilithrix sp.]|nr:AAA family ATPase [Labilithrix sp.]